MHSIKPILGNLLGGVFMAGASLIALQAADSDPFEIDPNLKPDDNRFTPVVVTEGTLNEPMSFEVLEDGRVFIIERRGGVKVYDPSDATVKSVGQLNVNTTGNNEQGLAGMTLDPPNHSTSVAPPKIQKKQTRHSPPRPCRVSHQTISR